MTELFEPASVHDSRLAGGAAGLLAAFNTAGVLEAPDVHVGQRVGALGGESDERVLLAVALAVRAVRHGSVCVDLATITSLAPELPWPEPDEWWSAVRASPLVEAGVVREEHDLLYLDRYHRLEEQVVTDLMVRDAQPRPVLDEAALGAAVARVGGRHFSPEQEAAAVGAARRWTTVLTGGPGTGKTTAVARLLVLLADQAEVQGRRMSVALAAPTGKAATRLQEAVLGELADLPEVDRERVGRPDAMTLHRLLGWRPDNTTRFVHHRGNRLKYDVVVVDESSMVELTMMGRLLEAVRPQARLVLVGDPRQLTSVGAGAVLSDLVAGYEGDDSPVVALTENFRSTEQIKALAEALRIGDADAVLAALRSGSDEVEFVETDDTAAALRPDALGSALAVRRAAEAGDHPGAVGALDDHRLLCAHREGPYGVRHWNRQVEQWLADDLRLPFQPEWYVGRPLLVTANDYTLQVYNGETGAVVRAADGRLRAWVSGSDGLRDFAPGRLDAVETMHAMTIHKSQGSQARRVTVLLPDEDSRLLTRELFYTAVTRAQERLRVVGSESAVRAAVATRAQRATGLRQRLASARAGSARGA